MVRIITQETYDEVVKENIEEFSMSPEEAIKDAVEQFHAQGVDLTNIIKDLSLDDEPDVITSLLEKLTESLATADSTRPHFIALVDKLTTELQKDDIARRVFAGKNGAYTLLLKVMTSFRGEAAVLEPALNAIRVLMTGNPDLLDTAGINLQKSLLEANHNYPQTLLLVLRWIRVCCIKHEMNRQNIFNAEVLVDLKVQLDKSGTSLTIIKEICALLRALTLDDDIRLAYGKAHNHATAIAQQTLHTLTTLLSTHRTSEVIVGELIITVACLIVRNEFCQDFEDAKGVQCILDVLTNFPKAEKINFNALKLLKCLAGNDDVKAHIITSGIAPLIISAISRLRSSEGIVTVGLACISALTLRSPSNAGVFYDCGTVLIIIEAIKAYLTSVSVIQEASWAVRNMSVRNSYESKEFLAYGIEELFNQALKIHGQIIEDDIKMALRDLGLQVNLKEQWTGKGRALKNE